MNRKTLFLGALLAQALPLIAAERLPTDPAASTPSVPYRSALEGYRSVQDVPPGNWRALNDEVGRVGGHIGIMRGAGAPAAGEKPISPHSVDAAPTPSTPQAPASRAHQH